MEIQPLRSPVWPTKTKSWGQSLTPGKRSCLGCSPRWGRTSPWCFSCYMVACSSGQVAAGLLRVWVKRRLFPQKPPSAAPALQPQALLPGSLTEDAHPRTAGDGLPSGKQARLLSIPWRHIRKASQGPKPLPCRGLWSGRSLRDPGCALFQAEPLPEACRLRGFWPRSLLLLERNTSTLLLKGSFLKTRGQAARIRVTGGRASLCLWSGSHLLHHCPTGGHRSDELRHLLQRLRRPGPPGVLLLSGIRYLPTAPGLILPKNRRPSLSGSWLQEGVGPWRVHPSPRLLLMGSGIL